MSKRTSFYGRIPVPNSCKISGPMQGKKQSANWNSASLLSVSGSPSIGSCQRRRTRTRCQLRIAVRPQPGLCVYCKTCSASLAIASSGDLYSCDRFVFPKLSPWQNRTQRTVPLRQRPKTQDFLFRSELSRAITQQLGIWRPGRRAARTARQAGGSGQQSLEKGKTVD